MRREGGQSKRVGPAGGRGRVQQGPGEGGGEGGNEDGKVSRALGGGRGEISGGKCMWQSEGVARDQEGDDNISNQEGRWQSKSRENGGAFPGILNELGIQGAFGGWGVACGGSEMNVNALRTTWRH